MTQYHIYHEKLNVPLIVSGEQKLVEAISQMNNFTGEIGINTRHSTNCKISMRVAHFICNNILNGKETIFQYLGECSVISGVRDFKSLIDIVNTARIYKDGEVIKSTGSTYDTVFSKGK